MTTETNQSTGLLQALARQRQPLALAAFAIAALMILLTIFWGLRAAQPDRPDYLPASVWSGLIALIFLVAGAFQVGRNPAPGREVFELRVWLICVGASTGLLTAVLAFLLGWAWQESIVEWINENHLQEARWVLAAMAIFLGGVTLMFVSMQPARAEERNSLLLRRLLYGTNSVLTGLLLLFVLVVANVAVAVKLPNTVITTAAAFKSLSEPGKEFLRTIDEDVMVYLIMPENHSFRIQRDETYNSLYADCRALLNACAEVNPHIKVMPLFPALDDDKIKETFQRLKISEDERQTYGMLVTYGRSEEQSAFIGWKELIKSTPEGNIVFQGENRLLTEINFLSGGAKRPVVYFTQSNLEFSIAGSEGREPNDRSARELVDYLKERKFEVKPLMLEPGAKPDLSDATMVLIAAPRRAFSNEQVAILREYMTPKGKLPPGKLVALLPAFPDINGRVSHTGLEAFLKDFGVKAEPNQRLFTFPISLGKQEFPPELVLSGYSHGVVRDHAFTRLFPQPQALLLFNNVRPISLIQPLPADRLMGFNLFSSKRLPTYRDDKFISDSKAIFAQYVKDQEENKDRIAKEIQLTRADVPIATYVAEAVKDGAETKERPRLLVIGTDSFIASDPALQNLIPLQEYVAILGRMLEVVREQPKSMGIEPQALGTFSVPENADTAGLRYLPVGMVVMAIIALGGGVWVARRS